MVIVSSLQGIILEWSSVRYGVVAAQKRDRRWSPPIPSPVELARGTVPGQIHIVNIDGNLLAQKTDTGKLIPFCISDLNRSIVCCPIGINPVICR